MLDETVLKPLGMANYTHTWWYNMSPLSKGFIFKLKLIGSFETNIVSKRNNV